MSTLQLSTQVTAPAPASAPQRPGMFFRALGAVVGAVAEANRKRAERELAKVTRRYGIDLG